MGLNIANPRSRVFRFLVTPNELRRIQRAAADAGARSVSDFVRALTLREADRLRERAAGRAIENLATAARALERHARGG